MIELQEVQEKATVALRAVEADAKAAAEADGGAGEATTSSVLAAHLAICMLNAAMAQTVP